MIVCIKYTKLSMWYIFETLQILHQHPFLKMKDLIIYMIEMCHSQGAYSKIAYVMWWKIHCIMNEMIHCIMYFCNIKLSAMIVKARQLCHTNQLGIKQIKMMDSFIFSHLHNSLFCWHTNLKLEIMFSLGTILKNVF